VYHCTLAYERTPPAGYRSPLSRLRTRASSAPGISLPFSDLKHFCHCLPACAWHLWPRSLHFSIVFATRRSLRVSDRLVTDVTAFLRYQTRTCAVTAPFYRLFTRDSHGCLPHLVEFLSFSLRSLHCHRMTVNALATNCAFPGLPAVSRGTWNASPLRIHLPPPLAFERGHHSTGALFGVSLRSFLHRFRRVRYRFVWMHFRLR